MSGRKVTRLYCSKAKDPHEIGDVRAEHDGLVVSFDAPLEKTVDGVRHVPGLWREADSVDATEAWCEVCQKRHLLPLNGAVQAAREGRRALVLAAEGMYRDPLGVLDRQARQKGIE